MDCSSLTALPSGTGASRSSTSRRPATSRWRTTAATSSPSTAKFTTTSSSAQQLFLEGYAFASTTDTEVILAAYDHWGADCVSHFNGMWAFALYDKQKEEIFCSRDRFGVKPFYFADTPDKFVFGSEIKQILAGARGPAVANMIAVRDFLVEGYHGHTSETFFRGIHSLRAGHNLIFSLKANSFRETCYYCARHSPRIA